MAPPPIPAPRESGTTRTTSHPLHWCRYGPAGAPRVLVLHGGPGAHHDYLLPQFLDLADEFELTFYDQRGGGRSRTDDPAPVTWRSHVDDLSLVAAELDLTRAPIVGYSWGALLAELFLIEARGGAAVARVALVDPAPASRAFRAEFEAEFAARAAGPAIQALRDALAASGLRERDPAAYRQRSFELGVAPYFADPARAAGLTPFRVTGRVQQQVWESLGEYDVVPALAAVRTPALVIHGREDPIPLASSRAVARALRTELVVLEDCGHVPYVERREVLFSLLREYLRGERGGAERQGP